MKPKLARITAKVKARAIARLYRLRVIDNPERMSGHLVIIMVLFVLANALNGFFGWALQLTAIVWVFLIHERFI